MSAADHASASARVWLEDDRWPGGAVCIDAVSGERLRAVADVIEGTELAGVAYRLRADRYLGVYTDPASRRRLVQLGRRRVELSAATRIRHRSLLGLASTLSVHESDRRVFVAVARSRQARGMMLDPTSYGELDKQADDPLFSAAALIDGLISTERSRTSAAPSNPVANLPNIDPAAERERSDAAWRATAALRNDAPVSDRSAMLINLAWPTLFSATAAGALPWWSPAVLVGWLFGLVIILLLRGWDGWEAQGFHPGGTGRDGRPGTSRPALIIAVLSVLGGAVVTPFAGVPITALALARRWHRRRLRRRRNGWPVHDPSARTSMLLTQPLTLELATAFVGVEMARPSLVGELLGAVPADVERAVERLRAGGHLELGRYDGTETTLALSAYGRRAYAEHLRSIAAPSHAS